MDLTPIDKEGTSIAEVDSDGIADYYRGNESNHGGNNHQRQNDDHSGRDGDSPSDGNGDQQGDNSPNASSGNNNNSDDDDDDGRKRRRLNDGQSSNPSDEDDSDDEDDDEDQNDDNDAEVREVIGADGTPEQPPDSPSHPATGILKPSTFGTPTIHPPQRPSPWPLDQYVNSIRDSPKMRPSTNHDEEETWSNSDYSPPIRYGTPLQPVDLRDIAAATGVARAASHLNRMADEVASAAMAPATTPSRRAEGAATSATFPTKSPMQRTPVIAMTMAIITTTHLQPKWKQRIQLNPLQQGQTIPRQILGIIQALPTPNKSEWVPTPQFWVHSTTTCAST